MFCTLNVCFLLVIDALFSTTKHQSVIRVEVKVNVPSMSIGLFIREKQAKAQLSCELTVSINALKTDI